jgi:GT2 family glycosyltransferase
VISIVTVSHGSAPELAALLDSVERHLPAAQVIVVDAGGDGGEAATLARDRGAELVERRDNPGFGAANNAGVELARHEVTALLNPDVELVDEGLAGLAAAARERDALFVPRLLGADGRPQRRTAHPLPGTVGALLPALLPAPLLPAVAEPWRARRARTVGWAIAACLVARTGTLRGLGPFDPSIFLFFEDLDLCLRARVAGVPTVFVPDVQVRHAGGHSTERAYGGEPHALMAAQRDAVVRARLGERAAALDRATMLVTYATRLAARAALGRPRERELAQWRAQRSLG